METIQGTTEMVQGFQFSLPMAGLVLSVAVLIALMVKGKSKQGLILFGSFVLFQFVAANQGIFMNMVNTLGVALVQPFVGIILDYVWQGGMHESLRIYSMKEYHIAMLVMPIVLFIASIMTFFIKETHCKVQTD